MRRRIALCSFLLILVALAAMVYVRFPEPISEARVQPWLLVEQRPSSPGVDDLIRSPLRFAIWDDGRFVAFSEKHACYCRGRFGVTQCQQIRDVLSRVISNVRSDRIPYDSEHWMIIVREPGMLTTIVGLNSGNNAIYYNALCRKVLDCIPENVELVGDEVYVHTSWRTNADY